MAYLFSTICLACFSQTSSGDLLWPIDSPRVISGNYGELRSNHFHAGIDFSTEGKIGLPVYAVSDGYVSRIKISSGAYGRAVYITHHSGNQVSLYAHFSAYAGSVADFVKREQLAKQQYEIEVFPGKRDLKIKKGELIGYSGNSGNSTGPHLHFEIRDEKTEIPLNPLSFYQINDTIKPQLTEIGFYDLTDTLAPAFVRSFKIKNKNDTLSLENDSITTYRSQLGFAFSGFDRFVFKGNPNVIFSAKLYLNDRLIHSYKLDGISFDEQRYVNEFSETIHKTKFQKCFLPTLYPPIYLDCINKGRIELWDTTYHKLKLELTDESRNSNSVEFYIRTKKLTSYVTPGYRAGTFVDCNKDHLKVYNGLQVFIPAKSLYYSTTLNVENALMKLSSFTVMPADINLRNSIRLSLKAPGQFHERKAQLILENKNTYYSPVVQNDSLIYQVRNFGTFKLRVDSLKPNVKTQLSPKKIKRLKNINMFSFIIRDNMSGISSYRLFVNEQWVIAEYDAKASLLIYVFNEGTPAGTLNFRVEVEDKAGNKSEFTYNLKR